MISKLNVWPKVLAAIEFSGFVGWQVLREY